MKIFVENKYFNDIIIIGQMGWCAWAAIPFSNVCIHFQSSCCVIELEIENKQETVNEYPIRSYWNLEYLWIKNRWFGSWSVLEMINKKNSNSRCSMEELSFHLTQNLKKKMCQFFKSGKDVTTSPMKSTRQKRPVNSA